MTLSAWWLLLVAVPVILLGEFVVRRVAVLSRFSIPVPVVGGLFVALAVLVLNLSGVKFNFATEVRAGWWTWLPLTETEWRQRPLKALILPLNVAFFTCIGLNASWSVARRGSWQLLWFLLISTVLLIGQNALGVGLAKLMGFSPLLGIMCGSVTLTGGHGTAMGFADTFIAHGLPNAKVVGVAAATFGVICGSLIGGPVATLRIRQLRRKAGLAEVLAPLPLPEGATDLERAIEPPYAAAASSRPRDYRSGLDPDSFAIAEPFPRESGDRALDYEAVPPDFAPIASGFLHELRRLGRLGSSLVIHLLILALCMKAGAWLSLGIRSMGVTFPVYMGSMLLGIVIRNVLDAAGKPLLVTETIDLLAGVLLTLFLSMTMASLNLVELASTAGPMVVVLVAQTAFMALFAYYITFWAMGRNYDAAVMSAGHCGFGMGATSNAIANMEALTERFGPSPQAFLVVSIVGAFLVDFTNALAITGFLNLVD